MKLRRVAHISLLLSLAVLLLAIGGKSSGRNAPVTPVQSDGDNPHCMLVGGSIMTNFGVIDQNTTLGTATGDLRGAVSGTLLGQPQQVGNTVVFHVQHHWVTESGDTLFFDPATATTVPLSQTLFAIVSYPIHLTGGTGRFSGAKGDLTGIGEVDLQHGTIFRYSGQVCFGE